MKMYKKSDLKYDNGLLVASDGEVVVIDPRIVSQANQLETNYQKAIWRAKYDPSIDVKEAPQFERTSEREISKYKIETPLLDEQAAHNVKIMEELDAVQVAEEMNKSLECMRELVDFVLQDSVVCHPVGMVTHFDCPNLGNPLKWTEATLLEAVEYVHGAYKHLVDIDEEE